MADSFQRVWLFGDFEFREATGELLRCGEAAELRPQAAKLLELLLAKQGQVVLRQEIQQHLWPDTVVDFEQGLNTAVRQLRRTLEEEAASPRYVQTVPRRGYRWIGPIQYQDVATRLQANGRRARHPLAWALALAALASLALLAVVWMDAGGDEAGAQARGRRLLVLPLRTVGWQGCASEDAQDSTPPARAYLADALTEELISEAASLSRAGIKVLGRSSSYRLGKLIAADHEGQDGSDLAALAKLRGTLRADYLLRGSLRCSGGQVRVSLRLVDAEDGSVLWGESFDRPLGGLSDIHHATVRGLGGVLSPGDAEAGWPALAEDESPSEELLKAEYLLRKRGTTREEQVRDIEVAHQLLLEAVEKNPEDARAHVALASSSLRRNPHRFDLGIEDARRHLETALRLRPDMAEAHAAKASMETFLLWDLEAAEESFRKALQLNPQRASTHYTYAYFFLYQGRFQEAIGHMREALDIDPVSSAVRGDLGWVYFTMRRYREAIEESRRTLELEPGATYAYSCLLWSYMQLGQFEEAAQVTKRLAELVGGPPGLSESLAGLPARQVVSEYFRARQSYLAANAEKSPVHPTTFAFMRSALGDKDGVLQALQAAYDRGYCHFLPLVEYDPRFDLLRDDPRYMSLEARIRNDTRLPQSESSSVR